MTGPEGAIRRLGLEELAERYLEGRLSPEQAAELAGEVERHPEVADELSALLEMDAALRLRTGPAAGAEELSRAVASRIRAKGRSRSMAAAVRSRLASGGATDRAGRGRPAGQWRGRLWLPAAAAAVLLLGSYLLVARGPDRSLIAEVVEIAGSAQLVGPRSEDLGRPAVGHQVRPGEGVRTGPGGLTGLRYADGTALRLGADAELRLREHKRAKHLRLERGLLVAAVSAQPAGASLTVLTPGAEARVLGTRFRIAASADSTRLEVEEGRVHLRRTSDGAAVEVPAGHGALVREGTALVAAPLTPAVPRDGLRLWLRADVGVVEEAGRVARWLDQSGSGTDAAQVAEAARPRLSPAAANGRPALAFDGRDDFLSFKLPVNGLKGMTIFLVSSNSADRDGGSGETSYAALYWDETANRAGVSVGPFQRGVILYFGTTDPKHIADRHRRPAPIGDRLSLTCAQKDGPEVRLFVDGREALRAGGQWPELKACADTGWIGRGTGLQQTNREFPGQFEGATHFPGAIAEILVYLRALPPAEREAVERYLKAKYLSGE